MKDDGKWNKRRRYIRNGEIDREEGVVRRKGGMQVGKEKEKHDKKGGGTEEIKEMEEREKGRRGGRMKTKEEGRRKRNELEEERERWREEEKKQGRTTGNYREYKGESKESSGNGKVEKMKKEKEGKELRRW